MKRKTEQFLRGACAFLSAVALSGCGAHPSNSNSQNGSDSANSSSGDEIKLIDQNDSSWAHDEITLRFWHGFTGADGDGMAKIVSSFNKAFAGKVNIQADKLPWDTLFSKLITSSTNPSTAPHIVAMGAARAVGMLPKNLFISMNEAPKVLGVNESDYVSSAWKAGYYGKTDRYSFPLDVHPTAMYYNKALISENEIPTTWDDFVNVCKAKTTSTVYGWAIPNMYSITKDIFYSMLLQNGGALLDSSTHVPTFASSQAISLLQKIYDWKYTDKISPSEVGAGGDSTLFKAGKSVFYFDGPWTINSFDALGTLDYGVAPMPGSTGEGTSYGDSHQVGFCKSTVTDNLTKSACYTFLNYLSSQGQTWAEAGQVPAKLSVQETTEYKSLSKLQAFTQETKTSQSGNLDYQYFYEAYNFMGSGVANALNNDKQPSVALSEQATKFTQFVKEEE